MIGSVRSGTFETKSNSNIWDELASLNARLRSDPVYRGLGYSFMLTAVP
jgi:hypothetical protein